VREHDRASGAPVFVIDLSSIFGGECAHGVLLVF
jgi:hypothetical protein